MTKWKCPCGHIFEREEMKTLVPGYDDWYEGNLACPKCGWFIPDEVE